MQGSVICRTLHDLLNNLDVVDVRINVLTVAHGCFTCNSRPLTLFAAATPYDQHSRI